MQDVRHSIRGPHHQTMTPWNVSAMAKNHEQPQSIRRPKRFGGFRWASYPSATNAASA